MPRELPEAQIGGIALKRPRSYEPKSCLKGDSHDRRAGTDRQNFFHITELSGVESRPQIAAAQYDNDGGSQLGSPEHFGTESCRTREHEGGPGPKHSRKNVKRRSYDKISLHACGPYRINYTQCILK
jgi:hypothetical protein